MELSMFGILIESQRPAKPRRHAGGSIVSVIAHGAIIGGAILATATRTTVASSRPKIDVIHIVVPADPPKPERPVARPVARPVEMSLPSAPRVPILVAPSIIPLEIPPIDFAARATPSNFGDFRNRSASETCRYPCATDTDTTRSPLWTGTELMMQLREAPVPPRYPEALRRAGISGDVLVKFVVDTLGRVDPATIEIISSTHELFTAAVRESLAKLRFYPSQVANKRVPAAAMMPFHFTLR